MSSKVYLIPNQIHEEQSVPLPIYAPGVGQLRIFFVEELKSARRLLKKLDPAIPIDQCVFYELSEHTPLKDIEENLKKAAGQDVGIISEAGCPGVADPGADLALLAHREGREVIPFVGPSSILLAVMASGLSGQNFAFNGYLPKEREDRLKKIKELEKRSRSEKQTQIFMEAPYRNQHLFDDVLQNCDPRTLLCVAVDIMASAQLIKTMPIQEWKAQKVDLHKRPALFLLLARS